jgi:hypothetical protein
MTPRQTTGAPVTGKKIQFSAGVLKSMYGFLSSAVQQRNVGLPTPAHRLQGTECAFVGTPKEAPEQAIPSESPPRFDLY